ncbi:hypothetical protein PybrP1_009072 [[Pythium] brassicae (nom. inval.)]|nr:hypothetical protein PybrP1_009072 [[Pythium] brassicae (nom. inval.)]
MDATNPAGRKRKSRFSDAIERPQASVADAPLDAVAIAKAAAAKIARAIPSSAAVVAPIAAPLSAARVTTAAAPVDEAEQERAAAEKRRRTEQIYQSVQQQMGHIQALLRKPSGGAAPSTFMPAPLLLDEHGRQVDESGRVIEDKLPAPVATIKANQARSSSTGGGGDAPSATAKQPQHQNPYLSHRSVDKEDAVDAVDPRLSVRKRETYDLYSSLTESCFVTQGTYVKQGEQVRAREAKKMLAGFTSGRNPRGYQKESIVPIAEDDADGDSTAAADNPKPAPTELFDVAVPPPPEAPVPDIEWWDIEYLPKDKRAVVDKFGFLKAKSRKEHPTVAVAYIDMKIKFCGTLHVIEHPARVSSLVKKDEEPVVLPLMLTAAERKKIRRQNRADREKEKQDKIALGLLPPPEPKVKLSNMMRVLADQAVADPSAIERKVREQVAQREKNHEMRNLARKLTPEERREKKLRKIKEDAAGDIHVAVFRVPDLSNPQHRFKVDVNAQQYHLTGGVLICKEENANMVVVEGGKKAIKHYTRLLTKRIDWLGDADDSYGGDSDDSDDESKQRRRSNSCSLVWQGIVARKAFTNFRFQECRSVETARKVMEAKGVVQYWDLVVQSTGSGDARGGIAEGSSG